jgi:hypothetical protein
VIDQEHRKEAVINSHVFSTPQQGGGLWIFLVVPVILSTISLYSDISDIKIAFKLAPDIALVFYVIDILSTFLLAFFCRMCFLEARKLNRALLALGGVGA